MENETLKSLINILLFGGIVTSFLPEYTFHYNSRDVRYRHSGEVRTIDGRKKLFVYLDRRYLDIPEVQDGISQETKSHVQYDCEIVFLSLGETE